MEKVENRNCYKYDIQHYMKVEVAVIVEMRSITRGKKFIFFFFHSLNCLKQIIN